MSVLTPVASSAATPWAAPTLAYTLDPAGTIATAVSWNAPSIASGSISGYSVLATPTDPQKSTVRCPTSGTLKTTACTLQLVKQLTYAIVVRAEIVGGTANSMSSATATTKLVVPNAPTGVGVVAGDRQLLVSWASTNETNVPPITSFIASVDQTHSCTSTQTSCTITGLTNRTGYLVAVTALNAVGTTASVIKPSGTPYKLTPRRTSRPPIVAVQASLSLGLLPMAIHRGHLRTLHQQRTPQTTHFPVPLPRFLPAPLPV